MFTSIVSIFPGRCGTSREFLSRGQAEIGAASSQMSRQTRGTPFPFGGGEGLEETLQGGGRGRDVLVMEVLQGASGLLVSTAVSTSFEICLCLAFTGISFAYLPSGVGMGCS